MKGPVVVLGPPGAGKSTAGRLAASALGMRFVDLDDAVADVAGAVAAVAGSDVARGDVFRDEGEASFRVHEYRALDAALDGSNVVIAAGAGVVDTGPARALLRERALCVALDVDAAVGFARLARADRSRPWLTTLADYRARELDRKRPDHRAALARANIVDSAAGDVDGVARSLAGAIHELRPVFPVDVKPDVVVVADGEPLPLPEGALVVVEDRIAALHSDVVRVDVRVPGGERGKSLLDVERLARALIARGLTRDGVVVGVGGGALLDVVGLAAALALRGVRWWAVPTTLLAQADAGVGGKTAVNIESLKPHTLKNMVGAFHPPERTLIARRFLTTLDDTARRAGRAEMLKHEMLAADAPADGSALDASADDASAAADDDVARSLALKLSVVRRDPKERGLRAVLNLGHTLAHALEATTSIMHGEAVRYGLIAMLTLSEELAGLPSSTSAALAARVRALGPMPALDVDVAAVVAALASDKKAGRFVLLSRPGLPRVVTPPQDAVVAAVRLAVRG